MKFNEKLIALRKKEGLSQEELGYKLNVTRQTVSKWELGQTTPEMDKLSEISRIFNISVDQLINESEIVSDSETNPINTKIEDQSIQEKGVKNKRVLLVLVSALILVVGIIVVKLFTGFIMFNKATDLVKDAQDKGTEQVFDFLDKGTEKVFDILNKGKEIIDNQVESESNTNLGIDINNAINSFDDNFNNMNNEYISEIKNKSEVTKFNSSIELYSGTASKLFVETVLDNIVTSNKKNDKKITVKYNNTQTKDAIQIKNIKKKIHSMSPYVSFDVSCEYDKDGYIYEVIIEKM